MDINDMFLSHSASANITNKLNISTLYSDKEKDFLTPIVESLIAYYHGLPEINYVPAEDTSGLDFINTMLFEEEVKLRKFGYAVVMGRMLILLTEVAGMTQVDVSELIQNMRGDESRRQVASTIRENTGQVHELVKLMNNMTNVLSPIITGYENV